MEKPLVRRSSSRYGSRLLTPRRSLNQEPGAKSATDFVPAHRKAPVGLNYASFLSADLTKFNCSDVAHRRAANKIMADYEHFGSAIAKRSSVASEAAAIWKSASGSLAAVLLHFQRSN